MGSRLLLRIYILEGEQGGVGSRGFGICITEYMIIVSLLVVTVEIKLEKALLRGNQCNWNIPGNRSGANLALGPGACT